MTASAQIINERWKSKAYKRMVLYDDDWGMCIVYLFAGSAIGIYKETRYDGELCGALTTTLSVDDLRKMAKFVEECKAHERM